VIFIIKIEALKPDEKKISRKRATKMKIAKSVINKNINVGSRIIFSDNEGESNQNVNSDDDSLDDSNGIDISKAKQYMQDQDSIDHKKEKERVKLKHKQLKRKGKREVEERLPGVELIQNEDISGGSSSDEDSTICPPVKRVKHIEESLETHENLPKYTSTIDEDEGLALHLLGVS